MIKERAKGNPDRISNGVNLWPKVVSCLSCYPVKELSRQDLQDEPDIVNFRLSPQNISLLFFVLLRVLRGSNHTVVCGLNYYLVYPVILSNNFVVAILCAPCGENKKGKENEFLAFCPLLISAISH